ncbi:unnamed protein product [Scytosiphon promiscuus]
MSSTVLVCYVIQGDEDSPETGVQSSFRAERPSAPRALTLFRLRELFPFEGSFHFRLRIPDDSGLADFCWVDLTNDGDDILELAENLGGLEGGRNGDQRQQRIHLKVLPLEFGTPVEEDVPIGVFSVGEGVGMAHGSPRVAVDPTEVRGLDGAMRDSQRLPSIASNTSRFFSSGGQRSLLRSHEEVSNRRPRPPSPTPQDDELAGGVSGLDLGGGQSFDVGGSDDDSDAPYRGARAPGDDEDEDDADWKASVVNQASQGVKDLQKKTSQVAKTMGFGAKKMWNAINKGVGGAVIPSDEALENLHELANFLATPFSPTNPEHIKDLGKVWGCLFPDDEFEGVESPRWQEAGFQEDNVAIDFRGTGVLALKSMVFFCQNYEHKALALCRAQSRGTPSHYPWAVVANNLTLMLAEVLELRADQYAGSRKGYWGVFDRRGAYFEVFCMAFKLLDHTWTERGAKRSNFGQIIGYTKSVIVDLLDSSPPNLPAFMGQAEEMGMLR